MAARSDGLVSPVRTAAVIRGGAIPMASGTLSDAARGAARGSCECRRSEP